jgi:predicted transcriptional regulator
MKRKKNELHIKIADFVRRHPEMTYDEIGKRIGMSLQAFVT